MNTAEVCLSIEYIAKKYYLLPVVVILANILVLFIINLVIWIDPTSTLLSLALYIPTIFAHEYSHYLVAKKKNPLTKIKFYPKFFALMIDYVKLSYRDFLEVAVAPLITIQLPLTTLYILFRNPLLLSLTMLHIASSLGDISSIVYNVLLHRGALFYMAYSERGDVVGFVAEELDRCRAVFYEL
jgi:hypothetical protein